MIPIPYSRPNPSILLPIFFRKHTLKTEINSTLFNAIKAQIPKIAQAKITQTQWPKITQSTVAKKHHWQQIQQQQHFI